MAGFRDARDQVSTPPSAMPATPAKPSSAENALPLREAAPVADTAGTTSSNASAGGHEETIPRTFLVLVDVATLGLAFLAAGLVAPWVQWVLLPSGPFRLSLPAWMSLPS